MLSEALVELLKAVSQNPELPVDLAHALQDLHLVVHQPDALCVSIIAGCEWSLAGDCKVSAS